MEENTPEAVAEAREEATPLEMRDESTTSRTSAETTPLKVAGAVPQIVPDDVTDDLKILLGEFEGHSICFCT